MRKSVLRVTAACFALATLLVAGCGGGKSKAQGETVFRGRYVSGFEVNGFTPCDSSENWWVEGTVPGAPGNYTPVYVEATGTVSTSGRYGHLGAYSRSFQLTNVRQISTEIPDYCK